MEEQQTSTHDNEFKKQAFEVIEKIKELGNRKYKIDYELNGWAIAGIATVILILILK